MANTPFYVPRLLKEGAWLDWRGRHRGGYSMYGDRALTEIRFFAPHHSVTNPSGNAGTDVDRLANIHINGNGWAGIGYNFVITSENVNGFAKVAYVGDLGSVRAHTPNTKGTYGMAAGLGNRYIVAACVIGMNHLVNPTVEQMRSMKLLAQELLWFEDQRIPNLWNTWDDFQPHYVWDWTQCNGMAHIRQAMIDVSIPSDKPPVVTKPVPAATKLPKVMKFTAKLAKTEVWDLTTNPNYKSVKTLSKGEPFEAYGKIEFNNSVYYVTQYSFDKGNKHGVNTVDLVPVPVTPPPEPTPAYTIRALGAIKEVAVDAGDVVVDIITRKVTREYTERERFEATHTVEYKGKTYYMTQWSFEQVQKGKNPAGVDVDTVDAWVVVPEQPVEPEIPPHEEPKTPVDEDLKEEHDRLVDEIKKNRTILEQILLIINQFINWLRSKYK